MGWFEALLSQGPMAERVCHWMCDNRTVARGVAVAISPRLPVAIARDSVEHTWPGYIAGFDSLVRDPGWSDALINLALRNVPVRLVDGDKDPVPVPGRADELAERFANISAARRLGGHRLPLSDPIGCASIVAKVIRDRLMRRLALRYPGYGWERNVGYGTAEHRAAIDELGVTPHHRLTFTGLQFSLDL